jgi:hypothetical protein
MKSITTDKSLARPERKQATSMSKSSWMMDPSHSREMPSCSAVDLAEIRRSSKISSWIWSVISGVVGLRTYQHPRKYVRKCVCFDYRVQVGEFYRILKEGIFWGSHWMSLHSCAHSLFNSLSINIHCLYVSDFICLITIYIWLRSHKPIRISVRP